jgi:formiminotetrahydrofolate cyclodeaminase
MCCGVSASAAPVAGGGGATSATHKATGPALRRVAVTVTSGGHSVAIIDFIPLIDLLVKQELWEAVIAAST